MPESEKDSRESVPRSQNGSSVELGIFVEKGKRKERLSGIDQLVVIEGWDKPKLETSIREIGRMRSWDVAKFPAFSNEWNVLLNDYFVSLGAQYRLIIDGRTRKPPKPSPNILTPSVSIRETSACHDNTIVYSEGEIERVMNNKYERDPRARQACIDHYGYACQACKRPLNSIYGEIGVGYIHVHHKQPLAEIGHEYTVDPVKDLIPVCPNCHMMLHRTIPPLTVEHLVTVIASAFATTSPK